MTAARDQAAEAGRALRGARRILVLGSPGAGKTTLARRLAAATALPLVHLDDLYWRPDWQRPGRDLWRRMQAEVAAGEQWIIDGNYEQDIGIRGRRAEAVVLIHRGRVSCLRRVLRRRSLIRAGTWEFLPRAVREQAACGVSPAAHADLARLIRTILGYRAGRCLRSLAMAAGDWPSPAVVVVASGFPHPRLRRGPLPGAAAGGQRPALVSPGTFVSLLASITCQPAVPEEPSQ